MEACPNIAGREIKRRITFGYIGLILTLLVIGYILFFDANIYLQVLIFSNSLSKYSFYFNLIIIQRLDIIFWF